MIVDFKMGGVRNFWPETFSFGAAFLFVAPGFSTHGKSAKRLKKDKHILSRHFKLSVEFLFFIVGQRKGASNI